MRPDFDADSYVGQLWSIPLDTTKYPRRITRGFRDSSPPAFSPDGLVLAFLRSDPDGKPQLFVVEAAGGEPQRITDQQAGVGGFVWAPDSHRIAFEARVPEQGRYGTVDGVPSGGEDARLITTNQYRMNGLGYTADQRQQLFVVEVPELGGEPVVVPRGRAAHEQPTRTVTGGFLLHSRSRSATRTTSRRAFQLTAPTCTSLPPSMKGTTTTWSPPSTGSAPAAASRPSSNLQTRRCRLSLLSVPPRTAVGCFTWPRT